MPHLTMEYSSNLAIAGAVAGLLAAFHDALVQLGVEREDCKSRAYRCEAYLVGGGAPDRGFVHVTLAVLERRPAEFRREAGARLLAILQDGLGPSLAAAAIDCDVTVEVRPMQTYCKVRIGG